MSADSITPALSRLLEELPERIAPERIDRIWVFPPRMVGEAESGLLVLSLLEAEGASEAARGADRREVVTVHYESRRGRKGGSVQLEIVSRGWAPAERVQGVIDGVLRRLREADEDPRSAAIEGDPERWNGFTSELQGRVLDPANG